MRVFSILLAYASAAVVSAVLIILVGVLRGDSNVTFGPDDLRFVGLFALAAAAYAAPIAVPVVIVTEVRRSGDWRYFIGAGALLGAILTILFSGVPFEWNNLLDAAFFVPIAAIAAYVYWLIAWRCISPIKSGTNELDRVT